MKSRIIINNESSLSDVDAINRVHEINSFGKISETSKGNQYCFATTFEDCTILCMMTRTGTNTFYIQDVDN